MPQTNFTDNVRIDGSRDIAQLAVEGNATQTQPLQTWQNSAGSVLSQVTGDGRVLVGDDLGAATPDALIEAHRSETSTARPRRGIHSLGRIGDSLSEIAQWMVAELELRGSGALQALQNTLRVRLTNMTTAAAGAGAELRAADIEVVNDASANAAAVPAATGLQVSVTNAAGRTITRAIGVRISMNNAGTMTNRYALFTEGAGPSRLEECIELRRINDTQPTPPADVVRIYPKADGRLYVRNWAGVEYDLTAVGGGGGTGLERMAGTVVYDSGALNSAAAFDTGTIALTGYEYCELILMNARSSRPEINDSVFVAFNGDATNGNYEGATQGGINGSGWQRSATVIPGSTATANYAGEAAWRIHRPGATNNFKTMICWGNADFNSSSSAIVRLYDVMWKNTAAITRIQLRPDNAPQTFVTGTRFMVIGYKKETIGGGGSSSGSGYILLRDEKTATAHGGTFTSGIWHRRDLNTEVTDTGGHCALSNNQFTLAAGTYRVRATAPAFAVYSHRARLQNVSDGTTAVLGTTAFADVGFYSQTVSEIVGRFSIPANKTFEIQHRSSGNQTNTGFGVASTIDTEIYTIVELIRE